MTDATPDLKIIDRITKLLTLSKDKGATEAEASLAAQMAQNIMAEHNLSMAAIEAAGGSTGTDGKREKTTFANKAPYKWMRELMASIGELNFCHVTEQWEGKGTYRHARTNTFTGYRVIGRSSNVAATQMMFDYLTQTINRLASEFVNHDPKELWTRSAASFREGCAHRLVERLAHLNGRAGSFGFGDMPPGSIGRSSPPARNGNGETASGERHETRRSVDSSPESQNDDTGRLGVPGRTFAGKRRPTRARGKVSDRLGGRPAPRGGPVPTNRRHAAGSRAGRDG